MSRATTEHRPPLPAQPRRSGGVTFGGVSLVNPFARTSPPAAVVAAAAAAASSQRSRSQRPNPSAPLPARQHAAIALTPAIRHTSTIGTGGSGAKGRSPSSQLQHASSKGPSTGSHLSHHHSNVPGGLGPGGGMQHQLSGAGSANLSHVLLSGSLSAHRSGIGRAAAVLYGWGECKAGGTVACWGRSEA